MSRADGFVARAALLSLLALALSACGKDTPARAESAFVVRDQTVSIRHKSPITFDVAEVRVGPALPLPPVTARIATVEALTSPSFAPLAGRVVEAKVHLGDHVERGQQLVLVRTADLATLQRELRSAELAVKTREASVERMRALVESRAGSENDLILAQSELEEARIARSTASARLRSLQIGRSKDETDYWVLASRSGTVVQLDARPGSLVGPDRSSPIATVADLAEVFAIADVAPGQAVELPKGTDALIYPSGSAGLKVKGKVEDVSEVVDPDRQTVPVRVRIDNRARYLRPNAYVDLTFTGDATRTSMIVPAVAVVRDGPDAVVFVESKQGSYVRRPVVVGRRGRDDVELISGVEPGERVVTSGALLLVNAIDVEA